MHWKLGVNTVKTLIFEKNVWVHDPPPSSYGGAAPEGEPGSHHPFFPKHKFKMLGRNRR